MQAEESDWRTHLSTQGKAHSSVWSADKNCDIVVEVAVGAIVALALVG